MIEGKVHKFGDNINTDDIIPAVFLITTNEKELAKHCFEVFNPAFLKKVANGDMIVAGLNFGCGSSREHAVRAIRGSGVSCIIAKSFARIFFRNAINTGLPVIDCALFVDQADEDDTARIQLTQGKLYNRTKGKEYSFPPYPEFLKEIISRGGLMKYRIKHG